MNSGLPAVIFEEIRNDIIHEAYKIGAKLPPERELATKYKASRFAVREAIAMLAQSGFVDTLPQSGTYVKDFYRDGTLETLIQTLRVRRVIERKTLDSLLSFRYVTETSAAAEAALRMTSTDLSSLEENLHRKKDNLDNVKILSEGDYDFHYKIIVVSENIINRLVFQSFKPVYSFFTEFFYSLPDAPEKSLFLNMQLYEAFKKSDQEAAREAMSEILIYAEKKVYEAIDDDERLIVIRQR